MAELLAVIKGGGDQGSGVAHRLFNAGIRVVITETERPTVERRAVSFAEAIYSGEVEVEGVIAKKVNSSEEVFQTLNNGKIPVIIDPEAEIVKKISPNVVVDAIMAKRNIGTKITDAPIVIGLGPGFQAGVDVHAVVETHEGHNLGKVIYHGEAEKNTGIPTSIQGYTEERAIRAPVNGVFKSIRKIGDLVEQGEEVGYVDKHPVVSLISGVIRGLLKADLPVREGDKIGDTDPRKISEYCFTISDRARAIGGGVLEAIFNMQRKLK